MINLHFNEVGDSNETEMIEIHSIFPPAIDGVIRLIKEKTYRWEIRETFDEGNSPALSAL